MRARAASGPSLPHRMRGEILQQGRDTGARDAAGAPAGPVGLPIGSPRGHRLEAVPRVSAVSSPRCPGRRALKAGPLPDPGEGPSRRQADAAPAPGRSNLHGDVRRLLYRAWRTVRRRQGDGVSARAASLFSPAIRRTSIGRSPASTSRRCRRSARSASTIWTPSTIRADNRAPEATVEKASKPIPQSPLRPELQPSRPMSRSNEIAPGPKVMSASAIPPQYKWKFAQPSG